MPNFQPENRYVVMHLHIYAQIICTLIQCINKPITRQFVMPSWGGREKKDSWWRLLSCPLSLPSLPFSAAGSDKAHVKEHTQHVSMAFTFDEGSDLNSETEGQEIKYKHRAAFGAAQVKIKCFQHLVLVFLDQVAASYNGICVLWLINAQTYIWIWICDSHFPMQCSVNPVKFICSSVDTVMISLIYMFTYFMSSCWPLVKSKYGC